jgi:hypothetical protein
MHDTMQITLKTGRTISFAALCQRSTYHGLLAGYPHKRLNDEHIAEALEEASRFAPKGTKPHLIAPEIETRTRARATLGPEERLPAVTTLAEFRSGPLASAESEPYSSAALVWFQKDFGLPDERVRRQLEELDWEAIAGDWNW